MPKAHGRPSNARSRTAGRAGLGLALAATTAVGVTVPAAATGAAPTAQHGATTLGQHGATALAPVARPAPTAVPAAPAMTYRVEPGDTVSAIAARTGTTVEAIVRANGLNSRALIRAGQVLSVPSPASSSAAPSSSSGGSYTVRAGDTVSAIARQHGTSIQAIVRANGLDSRALIRVGQRLTIPGSTSSPSPSTPSTGAPSSSSGGSYTVRSGDTVSAIARQHGTSIQAIVRANGLDSSARIRVGQRLTIPGADAAPSGGGEQLVPSTFLGRAYPGSTVAAANVNKAALLAMDLPSRAETQRTVVQVAREMGVDPRLAQAHAFQESGFNPASVSPANAIGTMQVIPSSGEWASNLVGREINLLDPYDNIVAGVAIIRELKRQFPGNMDYAIAAYYQGAGGVRQHGLYSDTRRYVAQVRAHMSTFAG